MYATLKNDCEIQENVINNFTRQAFEMTIINKKKELELKKIEFDIMQFKKNLLMPCEQNKRKLRNKKNSKETLNTQGNLKVSADLENSFSKIINEHNLEERFNTYT